MLKSFTVKNFRCFRELTVKPLERINLISGKNNVGKTALLEAIFLLLGPNNSELPLRINVQRGIEVAADIWRWLFFNIQLDDTIELESTDESGVTRSLRMRQAQPDKSQLSSGNGADKSQEVTAPLTTALGPSELLLEYQDSIGQHGISRLTLHQDEINFERAKLRPFPLGVFIRPTSNPSPENVERFSRLASAGREDEVLRPLRILEPRLIGLSVLVRNGNPLIHGKIGEGELLPLALMGDGMNRLLMILLAITSAPRGFVLIDEFENGLHYSALTSIWRIVREISRRYDTQIIATTHSWECIKAAHEAFTSDERYDFRLHRLERSDNSIKAVTANRQRSCVDFRALVTVSASQTFELIRSATGSGSV